MSSRRPCCTDFRPYAIPFAWATVLALLGAGTVLAAEPLVIQQPTYAAGDRWEFSGTENGKPYTWSRTIEEILPDGRMRVTALRGGVAREEYYDRSMNALGGGKLENRRELARYPMKVGDSWTYSISLATAGELYEGKASIVARETIATPAGALDCLKLEAHTTYSNRINRSVDENITRWHCPQVGWIGRELYRTSTQSSYTPADNATRETVTDLVRFTPGAK